MLCVCARVLSRVACNLHFYFLLCLLGECLFYTPKNCMALKCEIVARAEKESLSYLKHWMIFLFKKKNDFWCCCSVCCWNLLRCFFCVEWCRPNTIYLLAYVFVFIHYSFAIRILVSSTGTFHVTQSRHMSPRRSSSYLLCIRAQREWVRSHQVYIITHSNGLFWSTAYNFFLPDSQ